MSVISKAFDVLGGDMAKDLLGAVGGLFTSDEERLAKQNELQQIVNNHKAKMAEVGVSLEAQLTARHAADMQSDSWLAKNVRPLVLIFLTVSTMLLAYLTIFILPPEKIALLAPWLNIIQALLLTAFGFYFGGRSWEKVKQITVQGAKPTPAPVPAKPQKTKEQRDAEIWGEDDNISG